jgi:hypothetical protein
MTISHIIIEPLYKEIHVANFTLTSEKMKIATTVTGNSVQECIEKIEAFLERKLQPEEYSVKSKFHAEKLR